MNILTIDKTTAYRISNRRTKNNITYGPQIKCKKYSNQSISQLWMLNQIKPNIFQITNFQTVEALSRQSRLKIITQQPDGTNQQCWYLIRAEIMNGSEFYWLSSMVENQCLFQDWKEEKLKMSKNDRTLYLSQWQLIKAQEDQQIKGICLLKSTFSGLYATLDEAKIVAGITIVQKQLSGQGHQRWLFEKVKDNQFHIRSLCSGLILTVPKSKNKIIQNFHSEHDQQKWQIIRTWINSYRIKLLNSNMYLAVNDNKPGNLELSEDLEKIQWTIIGTPIYFQ